MFTKSRRSSQLIPIDESNSHVKNASIFNEGNESLAALFTYLVEHEVVDQDEKRDFENLTRLTLMKIPLTAPLHSVLTEFGEWNGQGYGTRDFRELKDALGSLYLERLGLERKRKSMTRLTPENNNWDIPPNIIKSYLPDIVLSLLTRLRLEICEFPIQVQSYSFEGFAMIADISGFTNLSAALCLKGR
jgi:hypothetical protein